MERRKLVLDMDVGVDDAVTIVFLAQQPHVEIVALGSVHGNIDAPTAALNALRTLEISGCESVPVAVGASDPLVHPLVLATHVHGNDGMGDTNLPLPTGRPTDESAAEQLVRLANEQPGELDLLAVGPLTNLALALQQDPLVLSKYRSVVIMGGAGIQQAPDEPLVGYDANIDHDPEAADAVFAAPANRVMVGINVTIPTVLAGDDLASIERSNAPHTQFLWNVLQFYLDVYEQRLGYRGCSMHDPLAAGVLLDPSLISASRNGPVEIVSTTRGYRAVLVDTPHNHDRPSTQVLTDVESHRFIQWLVESLS